MCEKLGKEKIVLVCLGEGPLEYSKGACQEARSCDRVKIIVEVVGGISYMFGKGKELNDLLVVVWAVGSSPQDME